ncbi:LacI family DNA-binding transcriptional regulator [soil metagenome]
MSTRREGIPGAPPVPADNGRPPTILELAAASGVSKATVSRVLNGSPRVATETRARVLDAIEALGFPVNRAARSLRTSRTGLVGMLVPVISVFGRIVEELDRELAAAGFSILLTASRRRHTERDLEAIDVLVGRGVDALVLAPSHDRDPELARALGRVRTPIVLLDREVRGISADALYVDQRPGISGALEHLVGEGRRRIGILTRDDKTRPGRQILARYHEGCARLGLAADAALVAGFDDLDRRTARDGVDALMAAGADAIIATGTMEHTATVLERLSEQHVAVPRDLGLVIYGYVGGSSIGSPGLPTVGYPVDRIAQATFRLLLPRLSGSDAPPRVEVVPNVFIPPARGV